MSTPDSLIDVSGLARRYGNRAVVSGLTLHLAAGQIVGLVGANGGGKTTSLRMFAGLLRPSVGSGRVLGGDIMLPGRVPSHRIGYMSQAQSLYPELTVGENLHFRSRILCGSGDGAARAIARYGLSAVIDTRVSELSGGWARRVQFAACVMHEPDLLLLDEPTAGLDARTRRDMWVWIAEQASRGSGALVSTHDLADAARCPLILHYRDGQVEGPLPPARLLERTGAATLEAAVIAEAGG